MSRAHARSHALTRAAHALHTLSAAHERASPHRGLALAHSAFMKTISDVIGKGELGYAVFKRLGVKKDETSREDVYW